MSAALERLPRLGPRTVEEWRAAELPDDGGRLELILGYFRMSPCPGGPHRFAIAALYRTPWSAVEVAGRNDLHVPGHTRPVHLTGLEPFEAPPKLPVGHRRIERGLLHSRHVRVVRHDLLAEAFLG